jgi:protein-S-isoprenylcysteine O-methyltransferase Ste14
MTRFLPLLGLVLFVGVGVFWRSWLQRRRFGHTGIVMFRSGRPAQLVREALALVLLVVLGAQAVAVALDPHALDRGRALGTAIGAWPGALVVLFGTVLMAAAQLDLGASWRIGIDEGARPGLVQGGLYRVCRNPIFLAMLIVVAGFAIMLPTWLSFGTVLGMALGIRAHVLDEEAYLLRTYGADYAAYARRVGRFFPGLGRLE